MEDEPLLEEMAEEDEDLDLYNEMTFGLGKILGVSSQCPAGRGGWRCGGEEGVPLPRFSPTLACSASPLQYQDSIDKNTAKLLMPPEMSPELTQAVAEETKEDLGPRAAEEPGEPQEEGGMEPEVEHVGSELEEEEEELGTEEQEEEQELCEEPDNLGDPAVMRAVQSKPSLEVTPEQRGRGSTAGGPHTWVFCPTEGFRGRFGPYQGGMSECVCGIFFAEPGLSSAGQQDWCLLGRV